MFERASASRAIQQCVRLFQQPSVAVRSSSTTCRQMSRLIAWPGPGCNDKYHRQFTSQSVFSQRTTTSRFTESCLRNMYSSCKILRSEHARMLVVCKRPPRAEYSLVSTRGMAGHSKSNAVVCKRPHAVYSLVSARGMAGHSKWANIRHIKAAKDGQKARVTTEFMRKLRSFIKETGKTDPKTSPQLAKLISEAKGKNIPSTTIERAIVQMAALKNSASVIYEAKGPGGSVMLIEAVTANIPHTRSTLQSMVKKGGFSMFEGGSLARMVYDEKGVVTVSVEEEKPDLDRYVEVAIEAGAEDVVLEEDEEEGNVLQFFCGPKDVYSVKKELEARNLQVKSADVVFIANTNVPMDSAAIETIDKMMDKLDEHPDVLRIYTNVVEAS